MFKFLLKPEVTFSVLENMAHPDNLKKILIAVEDSEYSEIAAEYGFALAEKFGAHIALVHVNDVLPTTTPGLADPLLNEPMVTMMPEAIALQEEASNRLFDRLTANRDKTNVATFTQLGNARDEILATAEEWHADLIILGTHGRTGFDHFISGSVSEGVVRRARCPVLIIPSGKEHGHSH
jgi:nucleotide-binding universal stress UspA family protein